MSETKIALTEYEEKVVNSFAESIVRNRHAKGINYLLVPVSTMKDFKKDGALMARLSKIDEPLYKTWHRKKIKSISLGACAVTAVVCVGMVIKHIRDKTRTESK